TSQPRHRPRPTPDPFACCCVDAARRLGVRGARCAAFLSASGQEKTKECYTLAHGTSAATLQGGVCRPSSAPGRRAATPERGLQRNHLAYERTSSYGLGKR